MVMVRTSESRIVQCLGGFLFYHREVKTDTKVPKIDSKMPRFGN